MTYFANDLFFESFAAVWKQPEFGAKKPVSKNGYVKVATAILESTTAGPLEFDIETCNNDTIQISTFSRSGTAGFMLLPTDNENRKSIEFESINLVDWLEK